MSVGGLSFLKMKLSKPQAEAFYRCDSCLAVIKGGDNRYNCNECQESYDLCEKCYDRGKGVEHKTQQGLAHDFTLEQYSAAKLRSLIPDERIETCFRNAFRYFAHRLTFGRYDHVTNTFIYTTFAELYKLVKQFASGLKHIIKTQQWNQMVSICSSSRMEWYIADIACSILGITTAPIGSHMGNDSMSFILNETEASVILCSLDVMKKLEQFDRTSLPFLKAVIVMDMHTPPDIHFTDNPLATWLVVTKFTEVLANGVIHPISLKSIHPPPSSIYTIMFTSGSTGRPKGCVFTRKTWRNRLMFNIQSSKTVWVSFLEPSHLFERLMMQELVLTGGKVGFHRSSLDHLFDDFALIRPTLVISTPQFWNLIYNQYLEALHQEYKLYFKNSAAGTAGEHNLMPQIDQLNLGASIPNHSASDTVRTAANSEQPLTSGETSGLCPSPPGTIQGSLHSETTGQSSSPEAILGTLPSEAAPAIDSFDPRSVPNDLRTAVLKRFRSILGGRQTMISTGGAPIAPAVKSFLWDCFDGRLYEGYGATEVGGITSGGCVKPEAQVKLVDVPEMGYFTTDNPPRGEICVKTLAMVDGYYKNEAETAEKFVDGYFRTGDIGVMESPDHVRIIDRKKNIFKLAQGEFVSPERLENLYTSSSPLIEQAYVYGNSLQMNVVAVVVPHARSLMDWWASHSKDGTGSSVKELCNLDAVKKLYLEEMQHCAKLHDLKGWEVPVGIVLESEMFTEENGLLTSALKLCRPNLEKKYRSLMENVYNQVNCPGRPIEVLIIEYFQSLMKLNPALTPPPPPPPLRANLLTVSFTQLGGDSMSAMRLTSLFEEHFNKLVSVQAIMTEPLSNILQLVLLKAPGIEVQTSTSIDWRREIVLDFLSKESPQYVQVSEGSSVLLTGATGFLGQFILLELLKSQEYNRIFCLVRGTKESAEKRVQQLLAELDQHFKIGDLSRKVVTVSGDLCSQRLGLSDEDYSSICSTVNVIIHNGAIVNAALPYEVLKSCNVGSTKEVINMARCGRPKFLHYVSTIGVFPPTVASEPISERSTISMDRLHELSGYAQSKWVAETLVLSAIQKGYINGSICRPGLVGPHSETGHANSQDWVCWIVRGLARLKKYPEGPGCNEVIYFIPVDYVAKAVLYFCTKPYQQHGDASVFHVVNDSYPVPYEKLIAKLKALFVPSMESCSYSEFRTLLTSKAKALGDPVLCSMDLLLPHTGGWSRSHCLQNIWTRDFLAKAGIIYNIENDEKYIEIYLNYLNRKGLLD